MELRDEMTVLRGALDAMGVSWRDYTSDGVRRTCYMGHDGMVAVITGTGTLGGGYGLLEAWDAGRDHDGYLTAKRAIFRHPPRGLAGCKIKGMI